MHLDSVAHFGGASAHSSISVQIWKKKTGLYKHNTGYHTKCNVSLKHSHNQRIKLRSPYLFVFTRKVQPNSVNLFARVAIGARWTPISGTSIVAQNTNIFCTRVSFITLKWKINKCNLRFSLICCVLPFNLENSVRNKVRSSPLNPL